MKRGRATVFVVLIAAAIATSFVQGRILWGYWFSRPSLASMVRSPIEVTALSTFHDGTLEIAPPADLREQKVRVTESFCVTQSANECREGRLLVAIEDAGINVALLPQVESRLWSRLRSDVLARSTTSRHQYPDAGVVISLRKPQGQFAIVARHVHIDGNDRYEYSERLYRLDNDDVRFVRGTRIWLEIGGLERLDWRWLAGVNVGAVTAGWLVFLWRKSRIYVSAVLLLSACGIAAGGLRVDEPWATVAALTLGLFSGPSFILLAWQYGRWKTLESVS